MPFTSASLMASNFAVCSMPFFAGFYSRDFILEMFSMRYVNIFGFFLLFVSTGLTVCYSYYNRPKHVVVHYIVIKYTSCDTVVFDYIQFSKFHTHNGDGTLPRYFYHTIYSITLPHNT